MKFITKTSVAAIALFAMTGSASALNCTTDTPVESTDVPDLLALVVGGPDISFDGTANCDTYSTANIDSQQATQDAAISGNATDITSLQGQVNSNDTDITNLQGQITGNDADITALQNTKADKSDTYTKGQVDGIAAGKADVGDSYTKAEQDATDGAQDTAIGTKASTAYVDSENSDQNTVIDGKADKTYVDSENDAQDTTLDDHDALLVSHGQGIAANASDIADNAAAIASNSDAIAANSAAINENSEGVAIAMAMPDSWLSDQENFAIAGGFGGFNGETAFGAIGTARIYGGFSAYAGGGISTSGNEWGWKVGARAGF